MECNIISTILQRLKARGGRVLQKDIILALIAEIESTSDLISCAAHWKLSCAARRMRTAGTDRKAIHNPGLCCCPASRKPAPGYENGNGVLIMPARE
ncbi:hypothetical protein PAASB05_22275 (plasmid) [Pantoea agglomerans]|uniref:biofilm development regulator YmgB/AriR family protein n=1 Tax=Pantoea TaxID=53335 RepID=UPI001302B59B|nr:hypothetical protein [Pantoea sp. 1B4]QGY60641.1 hypothetical protein PAASB05_22275 [Pantoea agglomerans]